MESTHFNCFLSTCGIVSVPVLVLYVDLSHLYNILKGTYRSPSVGNSTLPQVFILLLTHFNQISFFLTLRP